MKLWQVQDVKARFSEFLNACLSHGPQIVTRYGMAVAVLVPFAEWQRFSKATRLSLKSVLLMDEEREDLVIPPRGAGKRRPVTPL